MRARAAARLCIPLLAVMLAAALASCSGSAGRGGHAAGPERRALPGGAAAALGTGTLYLLAGPGAFSANLWQVDLPSGRSRQLTFNPRMRGVSNFSASQAGLVLGDARSTVDVLEAWTRGKAVRIGDGLGDGPVINAAGQVAYEIDTAPPYTGIWAYHRLVLRDGVNGAPRTIFRERRYGSFAPVSWSPGGTGIVVGEGPDSGRPTRFLVISAGGQFVRKLMTLRQTPDNFVWGRHGLAIGNGIFRSGPNEVVSLSGRVKHRLPGGWMPMCWNPQGTELLVFRQPSELGLWQMAAPARVHDLGPLPLGGLLECQWLTRPAAGT